MIGISQTLLLMPQCGTTSSMEHSGLIREPIGLRVLLRAIRPDDREPFLLWRVNPQFEAECLIEAGQADDCALLWSSLLRWSEAEILAKELEQAGWTITLHGVRAIVLKRAVHLLTPPTPDQGWTIEVGGLAVQAVPEHPQQTNETLARMLAFLEE